MRQNAPSRLVDWVCREKERLHDDQPTVKPDEMRQAKPKMSQLVPVTNCLIVQPLLDQGKLRVTMPDIRNIYQTKEQDQDSTCAKYAQVADNGKTYH